MRIFQYIYQEFVLPFKDTLFPPVCAICNDLISGDREIVCASCIEQLIPASDKISLTIQTRYFDDMYILCEYDRQIRILIHLLKYNRFTRVTRYFAERAKSEKLFRNTYDYVIPVPLHKIKLRERGYNQSTELARFLSMQLNTDFSTDILLFVK